MLMTQSLSDIFNARIIAAVAKVSCKHGLWLVARVNKNRRHCRNIPAEGDGLLILNMFS